MSSGCVVDDAERLSADDMATRRDEEFRDAALRSRALAAASAPLAAPGTCSNCAARCLPLAVYCDEECRADHEWRVGQALRTRKGGGR